MSSKRKTNLARRFVYNAEGKFFADSFPILVYVEARKRGSAEAALKLPKHWVEVVVNAIVVVVVVVVVNSEINTGYFGCNLSSMLAVLTGVSEATDIRPASSASRYRKMNTGSHYHE